MRTPFSVLVTLSLLCGWSLFALGQPVDFATGLQPRLRSPAPWTLPAPPTAEEQARSEEAIRQLLKDRLDLDADDPASVSRRLRELARGTTDDPAARYVLLRLAYDRARAAGDTASAAEIIEDLARSFRIDALSMKIELFESILAGHDTGIHGRTWTPDHEVPARGFPLVMEALAADRTELAEFVMSRLAECARTYGADSFGEKAARWSALVEEWSASARAAERGALRLLQQPGDGDAQLAVGAYLCFFKNDWRNGLLRLARGSDAALRALAEADLHSGSDPHARLEVADRWREMAAQHHGPARQRMSERAEMIYRALYPALTGLTQLKIEQHMRSRPLFVFDGSAPPDPHWVEEHLRFHANHGREGSGSWANLTVKGDRAFLVANRAGYVSTLESFPPPGVDHYQIEAELHTDLLKGVAFEFAGQRLLLDQPEGVSFENGWQPNVIHPLRADRFHHFLLDVSPNGISITLDGTPLGVMQTNGLTSGGIVLRGWEGHLRCRRLVVWAVPGDDFPLPLPASHGETEFHTTGW